MRDRGMSGDSDSITDIFRTIFWSKGHNIGLPARVRANIFSPPILIFHPTIRAKTV